MLGSRGRLAVVALAAALSSGMGFVPAFASQPRVVRASATSSKPGKRGLFNDLPLSRGMGLFGRKGAGISMAQQKRAAAKKNCVTRNRRSHR